MFKLIRQVAPPCLLLAFNFFCDPLYVLIIWKWTMEWLNLNEIKLNVEIDLQIDLPGDAPT